MTYGLEGYAQIEEKRLKHENFAPIESLGEIEQREIIATNYEEPSINRLVNQSQSSMAV